jgi:protein maelstrom
MASVEESVSTSRLSRRSLPKKFNLFSCLLLAIFLCIILLLYECRYYIKAVLLWAEAQEHWLIYVMFLGMFTLVSFPLTWGYTFLVIASGYLFGVPRGLITVVVTGNVGVAVAHYTMRTFSAKFPLTKLCTNDKIRTILMVVSGPRAFRVAVFARLTPIPFGLQNTVFAVS